MVFELQHFAATGVNNDCTDEERLQPNASGGGCSSSMVIDSNLIITCCVFKCNSLGLKDDVVVSIEVCSEICNFMAFEWAMRTMTIPSLVCNFRRMFSLNVTRQIVSSGENRFAIATLELFIFRLFL